MKCIYRNKKKHCTNKYSAKYNLSVTNIDCLNCKKFEERISAKWQENTIYKLNGE